MASATRGLAPPELQESFRKAGAEHLWRHVHHGDAACGVFAQPLEEPHVVCAQNRRVRQKTDYCIIRRTRVGEPAYSCGRRVRHDGRSWA